MVMIGKWSFKKSRQQVINELKMVCKLIEVPYTKNISSSDIKDQIQKQLIFQLLGYPDCED